METFGQKTVFLNFTTPFVIHSVPTRCSKQDLFVRHARRGDRMSQAENDIGGARKDLTRAQLIELTDLYGKHF